MAKKDQGQHCSFCGREDDGKLIFLQGINALICEDCVERAHEIIKEERGMADEPVQKQHSSAVSLKKPQEIKAFLDQYVIGQDEAKRTLAVAVYNHYKRISQKVQDDEVEIEKSNMILVGEPISSQKSIKS